jgi:YD repeat-containing protein
VDAGGRAVSVRDPFGRTTATAFDDVNRVTSVTDAHGGQTTFTYDENSNLLTLTDALSHTTTYTYDDSTGWRRERIRSPMRPRTTMTSTEI